MRQCSVLSLAALYVEDMKAGAAAVYVLDLLDAKRHGCDVIMMDTLTGVLGSAATRKVLHDGRDLGRVLKYGPYEVEIQNVFDTCVGHRYVDVVRLMGKMRGGDRVDLDDML